MGKALAEQFPVAKAVFDEVDDALGQNLTKLMFEGPKPELTLTENAQPALMAVSIAALKVLETECGLQLDAHVSHVAGHSLGEYSALAAAGTFSVHDAAQLLKLRGQSMQQAVPVGEGGMVALLGVGVDVARTIAEAASEGDVCQVANDNDPGQVVLSGSAKAMERVVAIAKEHGARRAVPLPVSAPFHCALMQPAADAMAEALGKVAINAPRVPLVSNVTAAAVTTPDEVVQRLVEQVTGTVRWRESCVYLAEADVDTIMEVGAGKVLAGLVKRTHRDFHALSVGVPDDLEAAREVIGVTG